MLNIVFMIIGFIPLVLGANILVDGAASLAKRANVPNIVIGLTIVSFGTSSPELVVNILSSIQGSSDLSMGNVIGSNIFNIFIILGITAIIMPLNVKKNTTWIEIPLCLLSSIVIFILANDVLLNRDSFSVISTGDGIILLCFFIIFLGYTLHLSHSGNNSEEISVKNYSKKKSLLFIILGLVLLIFGGKFIVFFALRFAVAAGFSERIISLTLISAGTSLPELATSIVAARKKILISLLGILLVQIFSMFFLSLVFLRY